MSDETSTDAAEGLQGPGRALYDALLGSVAPDWELDARDLTLLWNAARTADTIAMLEAELSRGGVLTMGSHGSEKIHPGLVEVRLQRQVLAALLAKIELRPPEQRTGHMSKRQRDQLGDARRNRWSA